MSQQQTQFHEIPAQKKENSIPYERLIQTEEFSGFIKKEKGIYHSDYYLFSNLLLYITITRCLYQSTAHRSLGADYGCMDFCRPAVFTRLDLRIYLC